VLLLHREVQRSVPDGVGGRFVRACAVHATLGALIIRFMLKFYG
jgi:hypothetical protein